MIGFSLVKASALRYWDHRRQRNIERQIAVRKSRPPITNRETTAAVLRFDCCEELTAIGVAALDGELNRETGDGLSLGETSLLEMVPGVGDAIALAEVVALVWADAVAAAIDVDIGVVEAEDEVGGDTESGVPGATPSTVRLDNGGASKVTVSLGRVQSTGSPTLLKQHAQFLDVLLYIMSWDENLAAVDTVVSHNILSSIYQTTPNSARSKPLC